MTTNDQQDKSSKDHLLGLFWKLSSGHDETRLSASSKIIEILVKKQEEFLGSKEDEEVWCPDVKYALGRLIHGLASERKASRLGFSCVMTDLLMKLRISDDSLIQKILGLIEENLKLTKEKGEQKGILFGRVFALLAIIHSCGFKEAKSSIQTIYQNLIKFGKLKSYLKPICYHGITELVKKVSNDVFDKVLWSDISSLLADGWESCDPELFQLLQACCVHQSETCGKAYLKANNWISPKAKKVELLGPHSYKYLGKLLPSTTQCHPRIHPLCYEIIDSVCKSDNDVFKKFWKDAVDEGLLESTPERKYLALKLAIYALPNVQEQKIPIVWSNRFIMNLFYALSNKNNPLHLACKSEIIDELATKCKHEHMTKEKQLTLLFQLFKSPAGLFLDDNTNTRCIQAVIGSFHLPTIEFYVEWLCTFFLTGKLGREGVKEVSLDTARRWSLSQLSHIVRNARLQRQDGWLLRATKFMFLHHHFVFHEPNKSKIPEVQEILSGQPPLSDKTRDHMKHCLDPALNALNHIPALATNKEAKQRPKFSGTGSDGEFWIYKLIQFANNLLSDPQSKLLYDMESEVTEIWEEMITKYEQIKSMEEKDSSRIYEGTALRLLLAHLGIRLLSSTPEESEDTCEVLSDLFQVVDSRFSEEAKDSKKDGATSEEVNWVEVIIETILSMLSQNSHSIRIVADQVFKLLSPQLTRKGLQLILHVLDPSKRNEILHNDDGLGEDDDVEDAHEKEEEAADQTDDSSDSDDSAFNDDDLDDEKVAEVEFRAKVKEALGDAAAESSEEEENSDEEKNDESESEPEMNDDAMMRIDSMLSEVFRQKKMTKRKKEQETQKQLLVFQLRCLDLIEIMTSRRHTGDAELESDALILETVRPLLLAIDHTSRRTTDMTLAEKASVLLRVKICKMKKYPKQLQEETISRCHEDIEVMMSVARKAHSVFMCHLASDCCLFLLRVLFGNNPKNETNTTGVVDVPRIQKIYKDALENFMMHRESHLQPCVIQDFISRFPTLAVSLAPDLMKYIKDGVQVYRKSRACFMLYELLRNAAVKDQCKPQLFQLVSVTNEIVEKCNSAPAEIKTKYCVEVMRLYHQAIVMLQATDQLKSLNKKVLILSLQQFVDLDEVKKSQELTNWTWKILHGFGVERENTKGGKRKGKKRKANLEKEKEDTGNKIDEPADIESTETRKELKAKVLKEKKEKKKKKGKKINKSKDKENLGSKKEKINNADVSN